MVNRAQQQAAAERARNDGSRRDSQDFHEGLRST